MLAKSTPTIKLANGEMYNIQEDALRCQEHQEYKESVTVTRKQWAQQKMVFPLKESEMEITIEGEIGGMLVPTMENFESSLERK